MTSSDIDLMTGVVPISKAASSLAALLKQAREKRQPIVVTQKGYPQGVILDVESYVERETELAELRRRVAELEAGNV